MMAADLIGFLDRPDTTPAVQRLFEADLDEMGFVMNVSRLWAYQPETFAALFDLIRRTSTDRGLTLRQRGILVAAAASAFGDSYCSLAWGSRLAEASDADTAAGVLTGGDDGLEPAERAMARWARHVARGPGRTTEADVLAMRDAGYGDAEIFTITVFVALRVALSAVNNALGVQPDAQYRSTAPAEVLEAVTFGRPIHEP